MKKITCLVLEDGTVYRGLRLGAEALTPEELSGAAATAAKTSSQPGTGEVVFNTGMTGYHEIVTDPSYTGQLVVMTYPHIGNYGSDSVWSETDGQEGAAGLVVREAYRGPVPAGRVSLDRFLLERGIPGISGIDTRALTLSTRERGNLKGCLVRPADENILGEGELRVCLEYLANFPDMEGLDLVSGLAGSEGGTGTEAGSSYGAENSLHFAVLDFGIKSNILRELKKRNCRVSLLPHTADLADLKQIAPDGVLLSNGPGDPASLTDVIGRLKVTAEEYPLFGICLGHQLISLALGAKTYKLKFGHHGLNHPVRDEETKKVYISSQNHGFAVEDDLPEGLEVWMRNANDGTVEAIRHREKPIAAVQFHPEAAPGPRDTLWIFDEFIRIAKEGGHHAG